MIWILRGTLLAALLAPLGARAEQVNDLREFRVGMPVSALPAQGYVGFYCANAPEQTLAGWRDWASCPKTPAGLHAVGFRYEDSVADGAPGKTLVAGQPVMLSLLIDDSATVAAIQIDTDPHAPPYLHKKAFLFALQAKARYGQDGWTCRQEPPAANQASVGGVFIHEHCEKMTPTRHLVVERSLYRNPSEDLRHFTGSSELLIERPD